MTSPSASLLSNRVAGEVNGQGVQLGYAIREVTMSTAGSEYRFALRELGHVCMGGNKANFSYDERFLVTYHYLTRKDYTYETLFNYDDALKTSATDNVESEKVAWTFTHTGDLAQNAWSREGTLTSHAWHGKDLGDTSDEQLVSPDLVVASTGDFTIAFKHRYQFEFSSATYWDGGVFEVSEDGGATWKDISTYGVDPKYVGKLDPGNTLPGRLAWANASAGYPEYVSASFNLGTALAGKTVKVRFRLATDGGTGAAGWDIDDIVFGGITNTPFTTVVNDATVCLSPSDGGVEGGTDGGGGAADGGSGGGTGGGGGGDDSGCSVGAAGSHGGTRGTTTMALGFFGGLLAFVRRRRRSSR